MYCKKYTVYSMKLFLKQNVQVQYISVLESEIDPIEFNSLKSGMSEQSDLKKIKTDMSN